MRELTVLTFQSLDGVMQAPMQPEEDVSGGFGQGGWASPYFEEVMGLVDEYAMNRDYDMLLGRKTYESFAQFWTSPQAAGPYADKFTKARKYVATNSLTDSKWNNSVYLKGSIPQEISRLKGESGPLLQVHGSWQLIQSLLPHDLVDEFRIWTFPVVVGKGKRLFGEQAVPAQLELKKQKVTKNGVIMSIYRRPDTNPAAG
ncbi:dihydrofolate reductase family protein [Flexibacterium corallicola]|uniref:dihydrofolate reductase family protein n=1 Tax=Flexibacterium corallicola TaxID=3037259 RepID=UPI00286EFC79|nr:dihydrofolate reductase family protein [Pseudovibrio sp. M1P-2-3]